MVTNQNTKNDNRRNQSGQSGKLRTDKLASRPSSLNGINKQLP